MHQHSRLLFPTAWLILALGVPLLCGCGGCNSAPAGPPWVVLSNLNVERNQLVNTTTVSYRFVQGRPEPGQKYYLILEERSGLGFVSFVNEEVQLKAGGGTLTVETAIGRGPGQVCVVLAKGKRSTGYSDPEPEHISGELFVGQSESSATPVAPGASPVPATFGQTVVLSQPRREGSQLAVDYKAEKLPEAGRFFLAVYGAEGGQVSIDVTSELKAAPQSGIFRRPLADFQEFAPPYNVELLAEPFGVGGGPPTDTQAISNRVEVK